MTPNGLFITICLISLPAAFVLLRRNLGQVILAAGAAHSSVGLYLWATATFRASAFDEERAFHDTYYVIAQSNYYLTLAAITALAGALTLALQRWGKLQRPKTASALFWIWHIATTTNVALASWLYRTFLMPRRYIDYEEAFLTFNLITTWSAVISLSAAALFLALLGWSFATSLAARTRK